MEGLRRVFVVVCVLFSVSACQTIGNRANPNTFDLIAQNLLDVIPGNKRVAIRPFLSDEIPIPPEEAERFNDALARALETSSKGRIVIVARRDLPRLFREAEEFATVPSMTSLLENAKADVLIIGDIRRAGQKIELSYKAADPRTGAILGRARPRLHDFDATARQTLPLDHALKVVTSSLVKQAPDLRRVLKTGVYFEQTDIQTLFGRYVGSESLGLLREQIQNLETDPALVLRTELSGVGDLGQGGSEAQMTDKPGSYVLSGSYWIFGDGVEIRLTLRGKGGQTVSAKVLADAATLSQSLRASLKPNVTISSDNDNMGPNTIWLDSDRGKRPVYHVGDLVNLMVQTSRDGYLYCFNQSNPAGGGDVVKVFPNQWSPDARILGRQRVNIPGDKMDFNLRAQGPAGTEYIRCFVLDRDVGPVLPPELRRDTLTPLGVNSLDDLSEIFRGIPNASVSEATLVLNIEK